MRRQNVDGSSAFGSRFNVLLTQDRPQPAEHWTFQLSRLLEPQGVVAYLVRSGREAIRVAESCQLHAAVIDMGTPLDQEMPEAGSRSAFEPSGVWLLELFRRLPNRPPVVIVHDATYSQRELDRLLREALRMGVFSVLNKPVGLEQLLLVFQRLVEKQYRGAWPTPL